jgi:hypothetical protein
MAHWHGLAKLRLHTDETLSVLDHATTDLGQQLRSFQTETCAKYDTHELKREAEARQRRQAGQGLVPNSTESTSREIGTSNHRKTKKFNLQTYKVHALGDYVDTIKMFGTTDSYTTAIVCISSLPTCRNEFSVSIGRT